MKGCPPYWFRIPMVLRGVSPMNNRRYRMPRLFALLLAGMAALFTPFAASSALAFAQRRFDPEGQFNPLGVFV